MAYTRGKKWVFTSFDGAAPEFDERLMRFLCYQLETAPTTGRLHWQGVCHLKKGRTMDGAKKLITKNGQIETQRGTDSEATAYCRKPESAVVGTYCEFGSTERCEVKESAGCLDRALECADLKEVAEREPKAFVIYGRGLERLFNYRSEKRQFKTDVRIFWGPTGTGKSEHAAAELPDAYWVMPPRANGNVWWDTYAGEEDVIIDDFDPMDWSITYVLRMLDRYPLRIENKGGTCQFLAKRVIITSHYDPSKWWPTRTDEIMRRVRECIDCTGGIDRILRARADVMAITDVEQMLELF